MQNKPNFSVKTDFAFYMDYNYKYINLGESFSGIGYVLVDLDGLIHFIADKHNLSLEHKPTLLILEYFEFFNNHLKESFQDVRYLISNDTQSHLTQKWYVDLCLNTFEISIYNGIKMNERIALVITSSKNTKIFCNLISSGFYTALLDTFVYLDKYVYGQIFAPTQYETNKNNFEVEILNGKTNVDFRKEILSKYNLTCDKQTIIYLGHTNKQFKNKVTGLYADGYIENGQFELKNKIDKEGIFKLKNQIETKCNDLDLCMPPIPEKISVRHMQNITKSAKSLCDGNFMYSDALMFSTGDASVATSGSKKSQKIIDQNNKKKQLEKSKADNLWLTNFFNNYSKQNTHKEKRRMLEMIKINNKYIQRKLLLLKIELYGQMWNVETKGQKPDESKLVPLYLSCLEYMNKYSETDKKISDDFTFDKDEMSFVIEEFTNAGFGATASELVYKYNLQQHFDLKESKPSDIDLYFQLKYCGQYLKRALGTKKDRRVPFEPDAWQVKLLDAVDEEKSVVISAPTSSGKTFICYYVVEKLLKAKNRGIKHKNLVEKIYTVEDLQNALKKINAISADFNKNPRIFSKQKISKINCVVFCLPTKALVNQVSADIYARFKPLKNLNLQGTLLNDRCSEPFNSQVLITIPSMLELILNNDILSINYIVIDEVHKINDPSLGIMLERVIHMAKCPILLLSATLGNVDEFYSWFKDVEETKGRETELITHSQRFCELRHFTYTKSADDLSLIKLNCMFAYTQSHLKDFGFGDD